MVLEKPVIRIRRSYLSTDFKIDRWEAQEPFYEELLHREISSLTELKKWLHDCDEIEAAVYEELAWRYIRQSCDTENKELGESYLRFIQDVLPRVAVYTEKFQKKFISSPFISKLNQKEFEVQVRSVRGALEIFRAENVPLQSEDKAKSQEYLGICGRMTIQHGGEEMTLQKAAAWLELKDREERKAVWMKTALRREANQAAIHVLLDELIDLRHRMAQNAGFENFTAYSFPALGRFDYKPEDCLRFHDSIEKIIKPVYKQQMSERRKKLGIETLRPWDQNVDIFGSTPLKPFANGKELKDKTIALLTEVKPELGEMIRFMSEGGFLDLESRPGKAPGGYNYPLAESGVPFIFMNAVGTQTDLTTILHECGHAFHTFAVHDLQSNIHKTIPAEVAELASMSMELISLDQYALFYPGKDELLRARREQVSRTLTLFPWIATIDAFQMWLYENPGHSHQARNAKWKEIYTRFHDEDVDWTGLENHFDILWQKQGHIFETPFYYIEYGIAQLGALSLWRNFRRDPQAALLQYLEMLHMGYTRPIPEVYEKAGIRFDFSVDYVQEIVDFTLGEIEGY